MPPSGELFRRARAGDREALSELLTTVGVEVYRTIAVRIPTRWQGVLSAEDVMQQTYLEVALDFPEGLPVDEARFRSKLFAMAGNNLHDALRALRAAKRGGQIRRLTEALDGDSGQVVLNGVPGSGSSPSQRARRGENEQHLHRALARLPASYGQVIQLYDLQGLQVEQVATLLGCSEGAVFMRRSRALKRLRALMPSTSKFF